MSQQEPHYRTNKYGRRFLAGRKNVFINRASVERFGDKAKIMQQQPIGALFRSETPSFKIYVRGTDVIYVPKRGVNLSFE